MRAQLQCLLNTHFACCDMTTRARTTTKHKEPKTSKATVGKCEAEEKHTHTGHMLNCTHALLGFNLDQSHMGDHR